MNLIVAVDKNWGIGRNGGLLTAIHGDMKYFKEKTTGNVVVMGRKTLESMPGKKALPNRVNFVLTSNRDYHAPNCIIVHDEEDLAKELKKFKSDTIFIIGGASIYNRFYKMCDKCYITKIDADLNADRHIVNFDEDEDFKATWHSEPMTENGVTYTFWLYEKVGKESNE